MMNRLRLLALPLALSAALVAAGCGGDSGDSVPEDAVAVVDGREITKSELNELLTLAETTYKAQKRDFPKAGTAEYQSLQSQAVAYLVQRVEYEQKADELGVSVSDADIDERIATVKKENFGGDDAKFAAQLKAQGYTEKAFRDTVRAQLLADKLYDEVTKDVKVTDANVRAYYNENKSNYEVPESRDVRHILVQSKDKANEIYDQLRGGADFAALAKQFSIDESTKNGGGKLTISRGQTVATFDQTAFLLPEGSISRPVKTEFGYHVIQPLSAVKPAKTTPFSEVKSSIQTDLESQRKNDAVTAWAGELQEEYDGKITYADGYEPPELATSGEETETGQSDG
jgi:parvulin-like peptidyl-prolyl isomerase